MCSWTRPLTQAEAEAVDLGGPPLLRAEGPIPAPPPDEQDEFIQMGEDDILDDTFWWEAAQADADAAEAAASAAGAAR